MSYGGWVYLPACEEEFGSWLLGMIYTSLKVKDVLEYFQAVRFFILPSFLYSDAECSFFTHLELFEIFRCHAEQKLLNNENTKSLKKGEDSSNKAQNFVTDSVVDLITMDVSRTFPSLGIFQKVIKLFC